MRLTHPFCWPEERIRAEMKRLDGITGLCGATLPIRFLRRARRLGAFCLDANENPLYFSFTQSYFENPEFSESEALDVIRHEYAHYMKHVLYPGKVEPHHGPLWHLCCLQVGAAPNRYYNTKYAQHLHQREAEKAQDNADVFDFMETLDMGQAIDHPTFGEGAIASVVHTKDNARVNIIFEDGTQRMFSAKWVMENCL